MNINVLSRVSPRGMVNFPANSRIQRSGMKGLLVIIVLIIGCLAANGQSNPLSRFRNMGGSGGGKDSLEHRKDDTIIVTYRYLDSSRLQKIDSEVYNFYLRYPLQPTFVDFGNIGTASHDLIFNPFMKPGWDGGWHAYDPYVFTVENSRFYNTTKPYSELGYLLGSHSEQMINLIHTQNITRNWNAYFQYRLISSPGTFGNQNTTHNNYQFSSWYQSDNKRYQAFLLMLGSKLISAESAGIQNNADLDSNAFANRYNIPTNIGASNVYGNINNPFGGGSAISTGTFYTTGTFMLRQQYDIIGIKDSVVTDSMVIPLFYPKFRAEQTISYSTYHERFQDQVPNSSYYTKNLDFISTPDTVNLSDLWHNLTNDFSLYSFPDSKNPQQFLKAGISFQTMNGTYDAGERSLYNLFVHGEYRNKTRNKKWDIEAFGNFYVNGFNAGDYNAYISLKRQISHNLGFLQVGFENVNRTVSMAWSQESSFGFGVPAGFFNKENIIHLFGSIDQPKLQLNLSANYYLVTNYPYFYNYYQAGQETSPFNVLIVSADKRFALTRHLILRALVVLQKEAGSSPVNIPLFVTHGQIGYEGKLGFKNLVLAFGLEFRYYTPYTADAYSPVIGQFFTQKQTTIEQKLPDLNAYVNFRIRSFVAYFRTENLNTAQVTPVYGFGFTNNNFVAPSYPYAGLKIRLGIYWSFVN
jgi:Putative porin